MSGVVTLLRTELFRLARCAACVDYLAMSSGGVGDGFRLRAGWVLAWLGLGSMGCAHPGRASKEASCPDAPEALMSAQDDAPSAATRISPKSGESPDYDALRREDFLPTKARAYDGKLSGGGAAQFHDFIEDEVIPLAEREYRADPSVRILSGASYGGLFVLYSLFEHQGLFSGYLALSPAVSWDERWIFGREEAFFQRSSVLSSKVWLSVGSAEWAGYVADNQAFFEQMLGHHYSGQPLTIRAIEGEAHAGNLPEAHTRSLRFFFREWLQNKGAGVVTD